MLPEASAWRVLFWIGILPAGLVFWIRRHVAEPPISRRDHVVPARLGHMVSMLRRPYRATTLCVVLMVTGAQGGSYALSVWLPTYLPTVRHLTSVGTGSYLLVHILGALAGFVSGAYLADAIGRKPTFLISATGSLVLMLVYNPAPISNDRMLLVGFPLGFIIYMMSSMGAFMTELFPTRVRGAAQVFCYNARRGIGALFPALVGTLGARMTLGPAIALFCFVAYTLMIVGILLLPETRGRSLASLDAAHQATAD